MIASLRPYLELLICRWRAADLAVLSLFAGVKLLQPPNLDYGSDFYERQQLKNLNKFEQKVQIRNFLIEKNHFSIAFTTAFQRRQAVRRGSWQPECANVCSKHGGRCSAPLENPGNQNL